MIMREKAVYPLYTLEGNYLESVETSFNFKNTTSKYLVHRAFVRQITHSRDGNASTKTKSEVRGGGRKPWRQKGTGRARAGSIRSPLWRGGGIIFGPKPRCYSKKLNKKEFKLALKMAIYNSKFKTTLTNDLAYEIKSPKTKDIENILNNLGFNKFSKILIIVQTKTNNLLLSCRNLPNVTLISSSELNIRAILNAKYILMTKEVLMHIQEVYNEDLSRA
nr:ribosomal protein L4 [Cavernulicola chilensis]